MPVTVARKKTSENTKTDGNGENLVRIETK